MIHFSSAFDGGNGQLVSVSDESPSGATVRLRITKDAGDQFMQWFYFRVTGARGVPLVVQIENAHEASYAGGFPDYQAVASVDRESWLRVPTALEEGSLTIRDRPAADTVWYAYFAPYPMERHDALIARCQADPRVQVEALGLSLDGQSVDAVHVGEGPLSIWLLARQHPAETMAEHWMEGFLDRLLDRDEPVARSLLSGARLHVVPNMNPDGSRRGYLRTNASGANLNREWLDPSMDRSPEVFVVRERMHQTGVDFCLDVHGDEALPCVFLVGPEGIPSLRPEQTESMARLRRVLLGLTPDFQTERGYPSVAPGQANLTLCTNYVAETFGCLAATLEMPFKDAANHPLPLTGWSPARCRHLGRAFVDAIAATLSPRARPAGGVA